MHLAQQTVLVVMMVVFSSTLVMAAGLVLALRASEAGRLWAVGHVIASGAGLVVAASAGAGSLFLGALGAGAYVIGRLTIYRGVRIYYGSRRSRPKRVRAASIWRPPTCYPGAATGQNARVLPAVSSLPPSGRSARSPSRRGRAW